MNIKEKLPDFCTDVYVVFPELGLQVAQHVSPGEITAYQALRVAPTLIELRKIGKLAKAKGITLESERGEWTADFVDFSYIPEGEMEVPEGHITCLYISRPTEIEQRGSLWIAHGGVRTAITLPPSGWVIPNESGRIYNEITGTPFRTVRDLNEVLKKARGSLYSFFWKPQSGSGLRAVNRECERFQGDAFEVSTCQSPDFSHSNIGVRCMNFT